MPGTTWFSRSVLMRIAIPILLMPLVTLAWGPPAGPGRGGQTNTTLALTFDSRGLTGLAAAGDPNAAQILAPGGRLSVVLRYRVEGGDWLDLYQTDPITSEPAAGTTAFTNDAEGTVLKSVQTFTDGGQALD